MIIVSACLAGMKTAYDGEARTCEKVVKLIKEGKAIPVCPEQLGGLPTPRIPAEIVDNKVINKNGDDVTIFFEKGAMEAFKIIKLTKATTTILKSNSPSCGFRKIYDGTFQHKLIDGNGIFTQILIDNGIEIHTEDE